MIEWIEVTDERFFDEGTARRLVSRLGFLKARVEDDPLLIELVAFLWVLLHTELLAQLRFHLHGLLESVWIDLLQDSFQSD